MILRRINDGWVYSTNSFFPDTNWTDSDDVLVVPDESEFAIRVASFWPYIDIVADGNAVVDVIALDPPAPPEPEEPEISQEIKALQEEFADMDAALQAILEVYSDAE